MPTRRGLTKLGRPETELPWDFNSGCNDCRADLQSVLDELVELGAVEVHPEDGRYGVPGEPYYPVQALFIEES